MASRMLHYVIAIEIAGIIKISNVNRFIIGSLIPDASNHNDGSYDVAHFAHTKMTDGNIIKGINWALFENKYKTEILLDPLFLGYMCHLITDAIWFNRIADKYIRIYPKKDRMDYIKKGYQDFEILNTLLKDKYALSCPSIKLPDINISEINASQVEQLFSDFATDFKVSNNQNKNNLKIYPYEDVMKFIDESIYMCTKEIISLRNKTETINPSIYYAKSLL